MLDKETKESILWKSYKGWGSTKKGRSTFEELYRSFSKISINNVLQYGHLIPQEESDENFDAVKKLDATNNIWYYQESSYKRVPVIQKHIDFKLKEVSPNCNESFVILDENGDQVKNIIPFDFSLTGLYNYELKTKEGKVIEWGVCDWEVDVDSSLLTFNNGIPEGVDSSNPPTLTFYQYIGPTGERHYLDAVLLNSKVVFEKGFPFINCSDPLKETLSEIHPDFYKNNRFRGSDISEGVGLQFNKYYEVTDSITGDVLKGYDDNSHSNVVSLLSHLTSNKKEKVLFVSEGHQVGKTYEIEVTPINNEEPFIKVYTDDGFIVTKNKKDIFTFEVEESDECFISLWVKDNETSELELFYPRKNEELNFKVPVFVDLIQLPPHLKLDVNSSGISDQITPDYYGPRTKDFIVAVCDEENPEKSSTDWRSSDFVIYNKENFRLSDAISIKGKLPHIYFRNGTYIQDSFVVDEDTLHLEGESVVRTVFETQELKIEGSDNIIENISFNNSSITVNGDTVFNNIHLNENCSLFISEGVNVVIKHSNITSIENNGTIEIFESSLTDLINKEGGQSSLYDSNVINSISNNGKISLYGSYCKTLEDNEGSFFINGSHIHTLISKGSTKDSIVATTNITKVESLPEYIKIDASYVTEFGESIKRNVYPNEATIPYYSSFNKRVYAKLPDPFIYDEEKNTIEIKLDTVNHTLFLNENGEIQCRFFSFEEVLVDDPSVIKTQLEEIYGDHADTPLDKDKPVNLKEAIADLYWSKADLKGGKVPIDQLPDSVAYGGLSFVGMWSFEKHNGEYPTFADVDFSTMGDDNYTDLQRGWFFIVEASEKEDDPCFPQTSIDGVEFTAGDWIVFEGKSKAPVVENVRAQPLFNLSPVKKNYHTLLQRPEGSDKTTIWSSGQQYGKNKLIGLSSLIFFEDKVDLYKSDESGFHYVESFPVEYKMGILDSVIPDIDPYKEVVQIKIGDYLFDVKGTAVRKDKNGYDNLETQYFYKEDYLKENGTQHNPRLLLKAANEDSQKWSEEIFGAIEKGFCLRPTELQGWWKEDHKESDKQLDLIDLSYEYLVKAYAGASLDQFNKWSKVDRSYLDPVYSRLPEMAPVTDDVNLQWSVKDGGTGLLQLSYKTLAEAIRLINEQLLKLSPDRSKVIQQTSLILDEKNTTAEKREVFRIEDGYQLKQVTLGSHSESVYESKKSKVGFKIDTSDELPLNRSFYCGKESEIKALDNDEEVECVIDRFDPYERFRLGFRLPSGITSSYVEGSTELGNLEESRKIHNVKITQYNVVNDDIINESPSKFEGSTNVISFIEQRIYKLEDCKFIRSDDRDSNFRVLQDLANNHTTGGYRYLPLGTHLTTFFTIKSFAKWGVVDKDSKIEVIAKIGDFELENEITSQTLRIRDEGSEAYDLIVGVDITLPSEKPYYFGDIVIEAIATNTEVKSGEVFRLPSVSVIDPLKVKDVVEGADIVLYPTLDLKGNLDRKTHFGSELKNVEVDTGLPYGPKGFGWPLESSYISNFTLESPMIRETSKEGLKIGEDNWRFITFKKSFDSIQDICGFGIKFDWTARIPEVNKSTGVLEDVIVQVCVTSDEDPHIELQNANKVVPVFFKAEFIRDEAVNFTGTSDASYRRITFGRKPVPVKDIFIRVGLKEGSDIFFDSLSLTD